MRRTTIYLEPDLELQLKRETRRQNRPMAELIREAIRGYLGANSARMPPGGGRFASGRSNTASDVDAALAKSGTGTD